jgi:GNAT superfamily N-acetyltransferase
MNLNAILDRLDYERRTLAMGGAKIEQLEHVTRVASMDGSQHTIIWNSMHPLQADDVIAEQLNHYRKLGRWFEWKVYRHDEPLGMKDRLASRGFFVGDMEAVMVLDLADAPAWIDQTDTSAIVPVKTDDDLRQYQKAAEHVFNKDYSFTTRELQMHLHRQSTEHRGYLATVLGAAVGVARLYTHPDSHFGGLYGGGILPNYRRRGFYRALIAARARDARELGAKYLIVDALPTSRPILEKLGFAHLTDTWPCECNP